MTTEDTKQRMATLVTSEPEKYSTLMADLEQCGFSVGTLPHEGGRVLDPFLRVHGSVNMYEGVDNIVKFVISQEGYQV